MRRLNMVKTSCPQAQGDPFDMFLSTRGFWRKPIAQDGSCLFRAVSEQVFCSQACHLQVRRACVGYMRTNKEKYFGRVTEEYLDAMKDPKEYGGHLEMTAMSDMYRRDFMVYQEVGKLPENMTNQGFSEQITLCHTGGNHYDSVYPASYAEKAAICQSIVYDLLYRTVFGMSEEIAHGIEMIRNKSYHKHRKDSCSSTSDKAESPTPEAMSGLPGNKSPTMEEKEKSSMCEKRKETPPFPYRIAKALDPEIYRNTEFDVWQDTCKDQVEIMFSQFSTGDKCQISLGGHEDKVFNCHIQEMTPNKGPVTVFIEELAEKHCVPYDRLRPLPQVHHHGCWVNYKRGSGGFYMKPPLAEFEDGHQGKRKSKRKPKDLTSIMSIPPHLQQHEGTPPLGRGTFCGPTRGQHHQQMTMRFQHGDGSTRFRSIINSAGHPVKSWLHDNRFRPPFITVPPQNVAVPTSPMPDIPCQPGRPDFQFPSGPASGRQEINYPLISASSRGEFFPPSFVTSKPRPCPIHHRNVSHSLPDDQATQRGDHDSEEFPSDGASFPALPVATQTASISIPSQDHRVEQTKECAESDLSNRGSLTSPPRPALPVAQPVPFTQVCNVGGPQQGQYVHFVPPQGYGPPIAHVPFHPYVAIPGMDTCQGMVNYSAAPSRDQNGADLPLGDIATLRFFYNLGNEYYRLSCYLQQQQQQQQQHPQPQYVPCYTHQVVYEQLPEGADYSTAGQSPSPVSNDNPAQFNKICPSGQQASVDQPDAIVECCQPGPSVNCSVNCGSSSGSSYNSELGQITDHSPVELSSIEDSGCGSDSGGSLASPTSEDCTMCPELLETTSQQEPDGKHMSESISNQTPMRAINEQAFVRRPPRKARPIKQIPPRFQRLLLNHQAEKMEKVHLMGLPLVQVTVETNVQGLPGQSSLDPTVDCFVPTTGVTSHVIMSSGDGSFPACHPPSRHACCPVNSNNNQSPQYSAVAYGPPVTVITPTTCTTAPRCESHETVTTSSCCNYCFSQPALIYPHQITPSSSSAYQPNPACSFHCTGYCSTVNQPQAPSVDSGTLAPPSQPYCPPVYMNPSYPPVFQQPIVYCSSSPSGHLSHQQQYSVSV